MGGPGEAPYWAEGKEAYSLHTLSQSPAAFLRTYVVDDWYDWEFPKVHTESLTSLQSLGPVLTGTAGHLLWIWDPTSTAKSMFLNLVLPFLSSMTSSGCPTML